MGLHSPEYAARVYKQVVHDSGEAGFGDCSIAMFGEPGSGKFEFVLTGRHCTRRCDGDSVEGAAFGGPIFYGHAADGFDEAPDHPGNAYWYQAQSANKIFQMLDGKQRESALLEKEPGDTAATIQLKRQAGDLPGLGPAVRVETPHAAIARSQMGEEEGAAGNEGDPVGPQRLLPVAGEDPPDPAVGRDHRDPAAVGPVRHEQPPRSVTEDALRPVQSAAQERDPIEFDHFSPLPQESV